MDMTKVMKFKRTLKTAAAVFRVLLRFRVGIEDPYRSRQDKTLTKALSCLVFLSLSEYEEEPVLLLGKWISKDKDNIKTRKSYILLFVVFPVPGIRANLSQMELVLSLLFSAVHRLVCPAE